MGVVVPMDIWKANVTIRNYVRVCKENGTYDEDEQHYVSLLRSEITEYQRMGVLYMLDKFLKQRAASRKVLCPQRS